MSYEVGSLYRTTLAVTDENGNPVDPSSVTLTVTLPDQTTATPSVTQDSTGQYHCDYPFVSEGLHRFTWSTSGPATTQTDYANAALWRSAIGLDEAKNYINDSTADKDPILRNIVAAATELAENTVGVTVPRRFVNERVPGYDKAVIRLPHPPLISDQAIETVTSVWPGGPSWSTADLIIYPDSGSCEPLSMIPFWLGPWKVTYTAGRQVIPETIQLAIKEIVFDLWSIHRPYGAGDLEPGPEDTARFEQMLASYTIPPHAKELLAAEEQPGFA